MGGKLSVLNQKAAGCCSINVVDLDQPVRTITLNFYCFVPEAGSYAARTN